MRKGTKTIGKKAYPWAWCARGVALAVNTILLMQITYFGTDFVGLSPALIGTLLLVSKFSDGFTDLFAGFIIDKTKSKLGKARPYELFLIPVWLFTVLLFSVPNFGTTGKAIYIFCLYTLINSVCVTFLSACETPFLARSTKDEGLRAKALTVSGIMSMIVPALVSMVLPSMITGWGSQPGGWTKIALVLGVPFCIIGLMRFLFIKETNDVEEKHENISIKTMLDSIRQNKYVFIVAGMMFACNMINGILSATNNYFFQYVVGDLNKLTFVSMLGLLTPFFLVIFPFALKKIGGMRFIQIGLVLAIVGNVIKYVSGANMTGIMIGAFLASGTTFVMMIGSIFMIQCMDYGEWKSGTRVEGGLSAVSGFAQKVGTGIASGLVGMVMGAAGYDGTAAVQSASAIMSIKFCWIIIPIILMVIMLVLSFFYDLEKKMPQIQADLSSRHEAKN